MINNLHCVNNYVLIKPDVDMDQSNIEGLSLDTTFDPSHHAARTGTVVNVPESLYFHPDGGDGIPWLTAMELRVGDQVTYHYLSGLTAEEKHTARYIDDGPNRYYFIKYDRIFTAKRRRVGVPHNIEIIMLNGFVLVEPVDDQLMKRYEKYVEIPAQSDKYFGRVRHMGSLNRHYGNSHRHFHGPDQDNIREGDLVVMDKTCDIPLEYSLHAKFSGREVFYRVQRRYIIGKINE